MSLFPAPVGALRVHSVYYPRPQPISGTSYNLERATARSLCEPGQDLIDELDEAWLHHPWISPKTDVLVQILERNEGFDQERTAFLSVLCEMCGSQQSVPKSMRVARRYNEQTIELFDRGRANAFRDEDRGRPISIKIVRSHPTNDLKIRPSVSPPQSCRGNLS